MAKKKKSTNKADSSDPPESPPAKRRRGRPRKDESSKQDSGANVGGLSYNEYQRQYQARRHAAAREIEIRKCKDRNRREDLLQDPEAFLKFFLADRFFRPFSEAQRETIREVEVAVNLGSDEIFTAPRGDWKTETVKGLTLYLMCKGALKFPVLIGATGGDAGLKYNDVKRQFEKNDLLADYFPEICDPIRALDSSPQKARRQTYKGKNTDFEWQSDYCTFPQIVEVPGTDEPSPFGDCALTYRGLDGQIRGINIYGRRPDLAFCDDLETRESADSDHQIKTREKLLDNDVAGLAGGGESLPRIVIGTIQNNKCLTHKKLIEWGGRRYQAVTKWPDDRGMELAEEYIEMRKAEKQSGSKEFPKARAFYKNNRDQIESGSEVGNPHCFSQKKFSDGQNVEFSAFHRVLNNAADNGWNYVHCELQNDPPDENNIETIGLSYKIVVSRISGYEQKKVPKETDVTVAAIDLGKRACHWGIAGFREGMIGNIVNYGVAEVYSDGGANSDMAIRSAVLSWRDELLSGELSDAAPDLILIDSGNFTKMVYKLVNEVVAGLYPIKGLSPYGVYQNIPGKQIVGDHWHARLLEDDNVWLYNLDTDNLKGMVHQMWASPTFDEAQQFSPMTYSLFSAMHDGRPDTRRHLSFGKHQVAEEYREEFKIGKGMKRGWFQLSPNNHWFDVCYMLLAGAIMKGIPLPFEPRPIQPIETRKSQNRRIRDEQRKSKFRRNGNSYIARRS